MATIILRSATVDDALAMGRVEQEAWPAALTSDVHVIRRRVEVFREGQWVAESEGNIVGVIYAQRITSSFLAETPHQYDRLTDRGTFAASHHSSGEIYQLVGVSVARSGRGAGVGRKLVDRQVERARCLSGIQRIIGFTRPVGYHRRPDLTLEKYVRLVDDQGRPLDPVLAFHVLGGATIVSVHEAYRPEDDESRGGGVLIQYDV